MPAERPPVLVSACLLGHKCRYDGQDAADKVSWPWPIIFISSPYARSNWADYRPTFAR